MIMINLLPARGKALKTVWGIILGLLMLTLLIQLIVVLENHRLDRRLASLRENIGNSRNSDLGKLVEEELLQSVDALTLQKKVAGLEQELAELEAELDLLEADSSTSQWTDLLPIISTVLPKTIWLTRIETTRDKTLLLEGKGVECDMIVLWMDELQQIPEVNKCQVRYLHIQEHETRFGVELWLGGDRL